MRTYPDTPKAALLQQRECRFSVSELLRFLACAKLVPVRRHVPSTWFSVLPSSPDPSGKHIPLFILASHPEQCQLAIFSVEHA